MTSLTHTYHIDAPIEKVWDALVNPSTIEAWGGGPAKMSDRLESFSLWDGEIHGKNIKVVKEKEMVQEWYAWDVSLGASTVTFTLSQEGKETVVELVQTKIPESEYEEVDSGWKNFFMEPLIELVENATSL